MIPPLRCTLCAFALPLLALSQWAKGDTVLPLADAFVDAAHPANNYGGAGALAVSAPAPGTPNGEIDSFISFDLSSFNTTYGIGNWTAQSITLQLNADFPQNGIFNPQSAGQFTVQFIPNNSWVEGVGRPNQSDTNVAHVNFNNHASYLTGAESLGTFDFDGSTVGQFTYTLNATPDFTAAVQAGGTVSLYVTAADANVSYLFNSKDNGVNNNEPDTEPALTVNVQPVPEPGALSILVAGAAALASFARPRRP